MTEPSPDTRPQGPLAGLRLIEIAGKGPAPFCAMMFADMGAEVLRIDRKVPEGRRYDHYADPLLRGRRSVALDLKHPDGAETVRRLAGSADAMIEGFRPGVAERLGIGPEDCMAGNPRLVYGRVTGWGREGPLRDAAGHDLNYIALSGALHAIGQADAPPPAPLALIGDFGGGGMYLAFGLLAAIFEARQSGRGQVVDTAMTDGAASLLAFTYGLRAGGWWRDEREANMLDGGAHFYGCYQTGDDKYISIGAIEPEFHAELLRLLDIDPAEMPKRMDRSGWSQWKARLAEVFRQKTRDEWCALLEGTDACFAPVLTMGEAPDHPQNRARGTFVDIDGVTQPAPAPRFGRGPGTTTAARRAHDAGLARLGIRRRQDQ